MVGAGGAGGEVVYMRFRVSDFEVEPEDALVLPRGTLLDVGTVPAGFGGSFFFFFVRDVANCCCLLRSAMSNAACCALRAASAACCCLSLIIASYLSDIF